MDDQVNGLREMLINKNEDKDEKEKTSRIIAISSGKGGVGKSTITVNLALALQELKKKIFIIDSDIGMANVDIMLDLNSKFDLHHVFKGLCSFEEAIATGPHGLKVLSGVSGLDEVMDVGYKEIKKMLAASAKIEEKYDIILLDVGAGANKSVLSFTKAAGEAIIVLTPEPTSIMDAYSLIKLLSVQNYSGELKLLVNQVKSKKEAEQIVERMLETINKYLEVKIDLLGFISHDSVISKSIKKQNPVYRLYPEKPVSKEFKKIAHKLIGKEPDLPSRGIKSFIYKVVGMVKRRG